ncbi:MAG: glycosyltransferase family 9 protein [Nitrospirae bacterium]|nr:glycosyltransferase family 9 protein [Nitrospirota bacterium]
MAANAVLFKDIKKILAIKFRHIGDVLITVPTLRALRETFPDARISMLVNSGTEAVLEDNPLIDEMIVFDRSIKNASGINRFLKEIKFLKDIKAKGFDMTIDLTSGDRSAIISFFSGARYRLARDPGKKGFFGKKYLYTHLATIDKQKHMALQNLDVVRYFGINTDNTAVDFFIPEEIRLAVRNTMEKNGIKEHDRIVHVHPTSRWLWKCWKDEYMAEVISWLIEQGINVIVTSAPDKREVDKAKKILSLVSNLRTSPASGDSPDSTAVPVNPGQSPLALSGLSDLTGKTTIKELAAISELSDLFIGIDSAPMHIAAAAGTPVIALFGPTWENLWGPYGKRHVVISKDMPCKPCKKGMCEGILLRECMEAIKPEEVTEVVPKILNLKR